MLIRSKMKLFALGKFWDNFIIMCVIFNTVILALDGLV